MRDYVQLLVAVAGFVLVLLFVDAVFAHGHYRHVIIHFLSGG